MILIFCIFIIQLLLFFYICRIFAKLTLGVCTCKTKLTGKTVLVTGASKGIGFCIAKDLAKRGARVIITSRDKYVCKKVQEKIIEETGNKNIVAKVLDYKTLENVRIFAEDILKNEKQLDILINNASNAGYGHKYSIDGNLLTLQLNYLGAFLLTNLLLGLMKNTSKSRIINVSSLAYEFACYDIDNINNYKCPIYFDHLLYNNAKFFTLYMTLYLANKLKFSNMSINCLHPGLSPTNMMQNFTCGYIPFNKLVWKYILGPLAMCTGFKTPEQAAQTAIHVAVSKEVENISGAFFVDCKRRDISTNVDPIIVETVWKQSVKLVKLRPEEMHLYCNGCFPVKAKDGGKGTTSIK